MDYGIPIIAETNTEFCTTSIDQTSILLESKRFYNYAILIGILMIIHVIILIVAILGPNTIWFQNLNKDTINVWFILGIWFFVTILSYIGLILLYELVPCLNYTPVILFIIAAMLTLMWVTIFYYGQNLVLSLWLLSIPFTYMFWVFMYMWYIYPIPAIFVVPLLAVYVYVFYAVAHLATVNNVIL